MPFLDIFSKKQEKDEIKTSEVIIDHREKQSLVPSLLSSLNLKTQFKQLPVGDYLVNGIVIERKTLSDLESSIMNKRIFFQIQELKRYPLSLLIIEGSFENHQSTIHKNALRGFFLSLALKSKLPFIFTFDSKDTAKYISLLAKENKNTEISLRESKRFESKKDQLQYILEGFPNIGPKTSKKLLKSFGTLKNIFNASEAELEKIIGKKAIIFTKTLN